MPCALVGINNSFEQVFILKGNRMHQVGFLDVSSTEFLKLGACEIYKNIQKHAEMTCECVG